MKYAIRAGLATVLLASSLLVPAASAQAVTAPRLTVWASYPTFSPDGDRYRDTVPIKYRLSTRSRVWIRIYSGTTLMRTLKSGSWAAAGTRTAYWDGHTGTGADAPVGSYRVVIRAVLGTRTATKSAGVALQRVPLPTHRWVGFYVPGAPMDVTPLSDLESLITTRATVSNYFQNTSQGFTWTQATNAAGHGATPMITLEFWNPANGVSQPSYKLSAIANGAWDSYLVSYARSAKSFSREVWLRPLHEMNGNWYPWGGTVNGNSPANFIAAWRHVKAIFAAEGATNVKFVWCPNVDSVPNTSGNAIAKYWPGDSYVDYVALDGYNFGGTSWRSFGGTFGGAYAQVISLTSKPIFIAETACSPTGGSKPAWIAEMFTAISSKYPRIAGVTWFNANKERDWRVECSPDCLSSFVSGVAGL